MNDLTELLTRIATLTVAAAFLCGLVLAAVTGSARAVKIFLAVMTALIVLALAAGLVFSRGLLVYLLFQLIGLVLVLYLVVIFGAVCGGGIYLWLHRKPPGKQLAPGELGEYVALADFCTREGIDEERALVRIRSGYYRGGLHQGHWYIHFSELSQDNAP